MADNNNQSQQPSAAETDLPPEEFSKDMDKIIDNYDNLNIIFDDLKVKYFSGINIKNNLSEFNARNPDLFRFIFFLQSNTFKKWFNEIQEDKKKEKILAFKEKISPLDSDIYVVGLEDRGDYYNFINKINYRTSFDEYYGIPVIRLGFKSGSEEVIATKMPIYQILRFAADMIKGINGAVEEYIDQNFDKNIIREMDNDMQDLTEKIKTLSDSINKIKTKEAEND